MGVMRDSESSRRRIARASLKLAKIGTPTRNASAYWAALDGAERSMAVVSITLSSATGNGRLQAAPLRDELRQHRLDAVEHRLG